MSAVPVIATEVGAVSYIFDAGVAGSLIPVSASAIGTFHWRSMLHSQAHAGPTLDRAPLRVASRRTMHGSSSSPMSTDRLPAWPDPHREETVASALDRITDLLGSSLVAGSSRSGHLGALGPSPVHGVAAAEAFERNLLILLRHYEPVRATDRWSSERAPTAGRHVRRWPCVDRRAGAPGSGPTPCAGGDVRLP